MVRQLRAMGLAVGKERVRETMKSARYPLTPAPPILSPSKGKQTTDSNHSLPIAPNLLKREFAVERPNEAWVGDITYVWTAGGWLYVATVIDLFSRQLVGFAFGERMGAELVVDALRIAWFRRRPAPGLIFHSDRAPPYASTSSARQLKTFAIQVSMTRKGDCRDVVVAESLLGSLKNDCAHCHDCGDRRAAVDEIMVWIVRYNHDCLHSTLRCLSPMTCEREWLAHKAAQTA